jgi:hypothetical protein
MLLIMVIGFLDTVFVCFAGVTDSSSRWRFAPNTTCAPEAKRASTPRAPFTLFIVVFGFFNTVFAAVAGVTNILSTIYSSILTLAHTSKADTSRTRHRSWWFRAHLLARQASIAGVECCVNRNEAAAHGVAGVVVLRSLGAWSSSVEIYLYKCLVEYYAISLQKLG